VGSETLIVRGCTPTKTCSYLYLSIYLSICRTPVYIYIYIYIFLSIYLSHPCIYLYMYLSIYLSIETRNTKPGATSLRPPPSRYTRRCFSTPRSRPRARKVTPKPETRIPEPGTLNPKPETRLPAPPAPRRQRGEPAVHRRARRSHGPKPRGIPVGVRRHALRPRQAPPSTLNPHPSPLNPQPSTLNPHP